MEVARLISFAGLMCFLLPGCIEQADRSTAQPAQETQAFHRYWHAGKAEVNSYTLSQSRYGENRNGKAVLIFVTEDLSRSKQVKLDDPSGSNKINVLKLNFTKKFVTGIYPYSLMLSVFTPTGRVDPGGTIKATMSSQEWCGQTYTQLNRRGNRYAVRSHSYFEQEADERFSLKGALLEDELWNLIRLNHEALPVGDVDIIPGLFHTRLNHSRLTVLPAVAEKSENDSSLVYNLRFPEDGRTLEIRFEKKFPHKVLGWKETWLERGSTMETSANLDKTLYTDYWTKNSNAFLFLRDSLNLPETY